MPNIFQTIARYLFSNQTNVTEMVREGFFSESQLEEQIRMIIDTEGIDEREYVEISGAYYAYIKSLENRDYYIFAVRETDKMRELMAAGTDTIKRTNQNPEESH